MNLIFSFLKRYYGSVIAVIVLMTITGGVELVQGRSLLGPDGNFGWWEGNIWSRENSQRLADPYSFSHIAHGILFYAGLYYMARKMPVRHRMLLATAIEACWELMENSPFIIDRYRAATIALGYTGDSVINSMSDIVMMLLGFLFAYRAKPGIAVLTLIMMEAGCALLIRDNLVLNVIMLVYPFEGIKQWQMAIAPAG